MAYRYRPPALKRRLDVAVTDEMAAAVEAEAARRRSSIASVARDLLAIGLAAKGAGQPPAKTAKATAAA